MLTSTLLQQLSWYTLLFCFPLAAFQPVTAPKILVGLDGFEPSTPALSRRCSNQLSYRPKSDGGG